MKNYIYLKGIVQDIEYSHTVGDIVFNKANLIVKRHDGKEDILTIKYKQFSADIKEHKEVELVGNIRSFSQQIDGRNKVEVYVFTYFDDVEEDCEEPNVATVEGRICKKDEIRVTSKGKQYIHFILANNIIVDGKQKLNSYIPCVAWGKTAQDIDKMYNVNDLVEIDGQLHSREYTKKYDNGEIEIRVAHEFATMSICKKDDRNDL